MNHLPKFLLLITLLLVVTMQSCIDKNYNWDDMDKSGVLNIPPVMFGSIDTIYLEGLSGIALPEGIPLPNGSIAKSDTIRGIFEGDVIKDFFFEGAGMVEISAKADVDLKISGVTIELYFNVINYENQVITNVVIPAQTLTKGKNQNLSIKITPEYAQYMEEAKDLELTIVISTNNGSVSIGKDDYIFIKNAIIKTGGYHFEL